MRKSLWGIGGWCDCLGGPPLLRGTQQSQPYARAMLTLILANRDTCSCFGGARAQQSLRSARSFAVKI